MRGFKRQQCPEMEEQSEERFLEAVSVCHSGMSLAPSSLGPSLRRGGLQLGLLCRLNLSIPLGIPCALRALVPDCLFSLLVSPLFWALQTRHRALHRAF